MCRTCLCYLCCCSLFQAFLHDRTAHAVPYRSWRRPSRKPPVGEPLCEQPRCLERQSGRLSTSRKSVIVQIAFPFHPASRPQYFRMTRNFRYARLWKPSPGAEMPGEAFAKQIPDLPEEEESRRCRVRAAVQLRASRFLQHLSFLA